MCYTAYLERIQFYDDEQVRGVRNCCKAQESRGERARHVNVN